MKAGKEIVMTAVTQNVYGLQYIADETKAEKEIVMAVVMRHPNAIKFTSRGFVGDRDITFATIDYLQEKKR